MRGCQELRMGVGGEGLGKMQSDCSLARGFFLE